MAGVMSLSEVDVEDTLTSGMSGFIALLVLFIWGVTLKLLISIFGITDLSELPIVGPVFKPLSITFKWYSGISDVEDILEFLGLFLIGGGIVGYYISEKQKDDFRRR